MNVNVFSTETVAREAASALDKFFSEQKGSEFLFLSSGGSSLEILRHIDVSNFGPQSTIGVLDERYSQDPSINNLAQLAATDFFKAAIERGSQFIDTIVRPGESAEDLATRFENQLKDWKNKTDGTIIASVGIGSDGHTSGIMPYPENRTFLARHSMILCVGRLHMMHKIRISIV